MNPQDPPKDRKKPGVGQAMRSTFHKAKDAILRRSSPYPWNDSSTTLSTRSVPESTTWARLKRTLNALESRVGPFSPLQSAISALIGSLDIVQAAALNRKEYEELVLELESTLNTLAQNAWELASESSKGSIANIAQSILQHAESIKQKLDHGATRRLLDATQDQEDVLGHFRQISRLFQQLHFDLSMRTREQTHKILETTLLDKMLPVDDARYNSRYSTTIRRRGCTPETREAIHQTLHSWTTDPESEAICWMNGMAGTGKTTIAYTFCEWLENTNRLGGSFFCSRISSTCRSLTQIIPTLAYQLAHFSPAFRSKLCTALNDYPDAGKLNVMQQFERLINQPLLEVKNAIPDSVVVVIDALDECDDSFSVHLLLDVLLKYADILPLKFFVAGRPEHALFDRMVSEGGAKRMIVHLHDIEQSIVEDDIKKYLIESFSNMSPPPSSEQLAMLANRSRNLFIYAATVVRYIYPRDFHVDSAQRLESMLDAIRNPQTMANNRYEDLDRLYTTFLSAVFHHRLDPVEKVGMERLLSTVVCVKEPMTVATIAAFTGLTERQVWSALQSLRSVIHIPQNNALISTLHASFPEYMLDEHRSKKFYCNESQSNERLVHRFFDIMKLELRFNICELESSYRYDDDVEDLEARVMRYISPGLSYSCRYWGAHLLLAPASESTQDMLLDFLSNRLLFWMEVLSICRCVGIGAPIMQQARTWLRQVEDTTDDFQRLVSDARNFVTWFAANPCSRSTPHIYISALPSCVKSNWVYQHYSKHMQGLGTIEMNQRDEAVLAIWSVGSTGDSLAISPDGGGVAAGNDNGTIHLYDINTGGIFQLFKGHTGPVLSVQFSPDGSLMASGSLDETVIVWDTHTGRIVTGPLHHHTNMVSSVAFSPDGKRLASGSGDTAVYIWEVPSGSIALGPLLGHSKAISSVAFSPDGQYVASGSYDFSIRLWDAFTGADVIEPISGHSDVVLAVTFSPYGSILASCSNDKTIRLWDIPTGTAVGQPLEGHKGGITSLAFSPNGERIVSGGYDNDTGIYIWDPHTSSAVLGPLHGHTDSICSVAFSPDGSRVVSGSGDRTIRIWDVQGGNKVPDEQYSWEIPVGPITFSPDRTHFISSSPSGRLRTWDTRTGKIIPSILEGGEVESIRCIAFSPRGNYVAAGASDLSIRIWNVLTRVMVPQPLTGHTDSVTCLTFSPDGAFICSGSDDFTIIVWNIETSNMIGRPYQGHTGSIRSVTYSPDNTLIASGANDQTIRIWDPRTGAVVRTLSGHDVLVQSVAFSLDGKYIISGGADGRLRKWNVDGQRNFTNPVTCFDELRTLASHDVVEYDCYSPLTSVSYSSDGTHVIAGFDSTIRIFNSQITELLFELSLPEGEMVYWVEFLPESNDILSVSISNKKRTRQLTGDILQNNSQPPNIIRVWRTATSLDQINPIETGHYWSHEPDGRILSPEGIVTWVPPDLLPYLKRTPSPYFNPFVLSPDGIINIGHKFLFIGDRWAECYTHDGGGKDGYTNNVIAVDVTSALKPYFNGNNEINPQMSIQEIINILSQHGCADLQLTTQMDPNQPSAFLSSGGGFGDIWRGELLNGTKVAIKTWRASVIEHCDYKMLKRAAREIYHWAKMSHENVHNLMGVIAFRGQSLGMVSEWMENGNLHEYLRKNTRADRVQLSAQVANGVAYVHNCSMIHGDIKALNFLVSSDGVAKLTDFGLSTMSESSLEFSATTSTAGSVRWAAPELLLEQSSKTKASDVYALGMTILEMFTGNVPYQEVRRDFNVMVMVQKGTLPARPASQLKFNPRGDHIWDLLLSCWSRNVTSRPSAKQVADSMESLQYV